MRALECLMSSAIAHPIVLTAHSSSPSDAIHEFEVRIEATPTGALRFAYSLRAEMSRLRIPSQVQPDRADGLWKHTCFEAFIAPQPPGEYLEFNFAPSTQWAAYRFNGYRDGMSALQLESAPEISMHQSRQQLQLVAVVHLPTGVRANAPHRLMLAIAAVLEEDNGRLSYWAARHPAGKPDFHHPEAFAVEL
jgi:hypothetical protein